MRKPLPIPLDATEVVVVTRYNTTIAKVDRHTKACVYVGGKRYHRKDGTRVGSSYRTSTIEAVTAEHRLRATYVRLGADLTQAVGRIERAWRLSYQQPLSPHHDVARIERVIEALNNAATALERAFDIDPPSDSE